MFSACEVELLCVVCCQNSIINVTTFNCHKALLQFVHVFVMLITT